MRADHGVDAISADDHVGRRARAVRKMQLDAGGAFLDGHAPPAERQPLAAQAVGERLQERNAMHTVVGGAERRLVRPAAADWMFGDDLAGIPAPND